MDEKYCKGGATRHTKSICIPCKGGTHSVCLGSPCECAGHGHKIV